MTPIRQQPPPLLTYEQEAAAIELADLDVHLWFDLAAKLTCAEADTFAGFLSEFVDGFPVGQFMDAHAEGDDVGDRHHQTPDLQPEAGSTTTPKEV